MTFQANCSVNVFVTTLQIICCWRLLYNACMKCTCHGHYTNTVSSAAWIGVWLSQKYSADVALHYCLEWQDQAERADTMDTSKWGWGGQGLPNIHCAPWVVVFYVTHTMNACSTLAACAVLTELRDQGGFKAITGSAGLPSTSEETKILVPLIPSWYIELQTHPWLWIWPPCVRRCWRGWVVCGRRGDTHVH